MPLRLDGEIGSKNREFGKNRSTPVLHGIQLWTIRWQKSYVFRDLFTFMPASTVENQNAVVPRLYRSTGEMFVHGPRVGVADRKHPFCTRGSEKIDVAVAVSDPRAVILARP